MKKHIVDEKNGLACILLPAFLLKFIAIFLTSVYFVMHCHISLYPEVSSLSIFFGLLLARRFYRRTALFLPPVKLGFIFTHKYTKRRNRIHLFSKSYFNRRYGASVHMGFGKYIILLTANIHIIRNFIHSTSLLLFGTMKLPNNRRIFIYGKAYC